FEKLAYSTILFRGEYDPAKYEYQGSPSEQQGSYAVAPQQQAAYAAAPQQQAAFAAGPQQQGSFAAASEQQGSFAAASEQQGQVAPAPAPREGKQYSNAQVQASYQNAQQFGKYGQQSSFGQGQQQQFGQGQKQQLSQSSQYYQKQQSGQFGQQGGQQGGQYGQQSGYGQHQQVEKLEEPEPTGPPRGFFYSFDYPVSIIVRKDAQGQNGPVNPGHPVDHDTVQQG
ncbi:glutenin, high molecular weight subunit DX5-like, partial [Hyposmocoma kahamanoa]|uniref:glutenin, high molecular weight subunit DX5-like n=1 Tax=Hyposmocoma kahamanoa TaxID=1477025 RepID=UPI000E6D6D70